MFSLIIKELEADEFSTLKSLWCILKKDLKHLNIPSIKYKPCAGSFTSWIYFFQGTLNVYIRCYIDVHS